MATTYDINTYHGDTWNGAQFTITLNSSPLNLTGASIVMQLKKDPALPVLETLSTANGKITITNAVAGVFSIPAYIFTVPAGNYWYDIQITIGTVVKTYIKGKVISAKDVSGA
jgi:hypothetical protein